VTDSLLLKLREKYYIERHTGLGYISPSDWHIRDWSARGERGLLL